MNDLEETTRNAESLEMETSSPEEARAFAAEKWGIGLDDVDVEVLDEGKRLFGLLGKKMKVRVFSKEPICILRARDFARELVDKMELDVTPDLLENGTVDINGPEAGIVIGRFGETLRAMEYISNLIYRDNTSAERIRFDSSGYNERRENNLVRLAESAAKEALRKGRPVKLDPMLSWERRIVHVALKEYVDIETSSVGEDPARRIVIHPMKQENASHRVFRKH